MNIIMPHCRVVGTIHVFNFFTKVSSKIGFSVKNYNFNK